MKAHPPRAEIYKKCNGLIAVRYRDIGLAGKPEPTKTFRQIDTPLPDKPERPCSRCEKIFQPTIRRRLLCWYCYTYAEHSWMPAPEDE